MPALLTWSLLQVMTIHFYLALFLLPPKPRSILADQSTLNSSQLIYHQCLRENKHNSDTAFAYRAVNLAIAKQSDTVIAL